MMDSSSDAVRPEADSAGIGRRPRRPTTCWCTLAAPRRHTRRSSELRPADVKVS